MLNDGKILWKDNVLKNRATASRNITERELKLFINKEKLQCFTDFTNYTCSMEGFLNAIKNVTQETDPVPPPHIDTCTCMYVYNTINLILLKLNADLLNDIRKKGMFVLFIKLYKLFANYTIQFKCI